MKVTFLFPLLSAVGLSYMHPLFRQAAPHYINDSVIIAHVLDGSVTEWPEQRFTTHKESTIRYAADNDANDLFLAISIPSRAMQARLMQAGMTFYIDINGKKKQSRGVEFPIVNENSPDLPAERNPDITAIRSKTILNLIKLKVFGFSDNELPYQELTMPGSVNVAYNWDSAQVMNIEYRIPLSLFGNAASMNQKTVSIGWKIHPVQSAMQTPPVTSTSTRVVGVRSGSRPTTTPDLTSSRLGSSNVMTDEQQFWSKYLIAFPK